MTELATFPATPPKTFWGVRRCHATRCLAALAATSLLGACAPYVRSPGLERSLPAAPQPGGPTDFQGDLAQAIHDVDVQRSAYLDALDQRTIGRNALSTGMIVLSAAALYRGVSGTDTRQELARVGAVAGGAYAAGQYSNSPPTERAYVLAHRGLSCLILRTRPWLITRMDYRALFGQDNPGLLPAPSHSPSAAPGAPDPALVAVLHARINELDHSIEAAAAAAANPQFRSKHKALSQALYRGRQTFRQVQNFKRYVDTAGFQLRQEANLFISLVNQEIQQNQPTLFQPTVGITQMADIRKAFENIKPVDLGTAGKADDSQDDGAPGGKAGATSGAAPGAALMAAGKPAAPPASARSEAGKAADGVDERLGKLEDRVDTLTERVKALNASKHAGGQPPAAGTPPATEADLAQKMTALYAAMRPIAAVLSQVYALKPYVKAVAECQPSQQELLQLQPDDDEVTVEAGASYEVSITGGVGYPRVSLGGTVPEGVTLDTTLKDGVARAKLAVPAGAKAGSFKLLVRDGAGTQRDEVSFTVKPAAATKSP